MDHYRALFCYSQDLKLSKNLAVVYFRLYSALFWQHFGYIYASSSIIRTCISDFSQTSLGQMRV